MSVQYLADASQKLTWPVVTGVIPDTTDAVSVTNVPTSIDVAGLLFAVAARLVKVAAGGVASAAVAASKIPRVGRTSSK